MSLVDMTAAPMRQESVAWEVLDASLAMIGVVHPSRDAAPSIRQDTTRTIKRTLSGLRFPASEVADLNPFSDRLRPRWVIGGDPTLYPLGVYLFADRNDLVRSYGSDADVELVDQTFIVDQPIPYGVSYPIGQPIGPALAALVAGAGVPSYFVAPSATTLQRPASWPGGTSLYKVLADLCALAAFTPPYFDNAGTLQLRDAPDPETATPTRVYGPTAPIIDPSIVRTDDLLTAPNRWIVADNGATFGPVVGSYELPASAPHSFFARGFYVTSYTEMQGIASAGAAVAAAKALAAIDTSGVERTSFSTVADPRHDSFDVVEYLGRRWLEERWSLELKAGGQQAHELRALYGP